MMLSRRARDLKISGMQIQVLLGIFTVKIRRRFTDKYSLSVYAYMNEMSHRLIMI